MEHAHADVVGSEGMILGTPRPVATIPPHRHIYETIVKKDIHTYYTPTGWRYGEYTTTTPLHLISGIGNGRGRDIVPGDSRQYSASYGAIVMNYSGSDIYVLGTGYREPTRIRSLPYADLPHRYNSAPSVNSRHSAPYYGLIQVLGQLNAPNEVVTMNGNNTYVKLQCFAEGHLNSIVNHPVYVEAFGVVIGLECHKDQLENYLPSRGSYPRLVANRIKKDIPEYRGITEYIHINLHDESIQHMFVDTRINAFAKVECSHDYSTREAITIYYNVVSPDGVYTPRVACSILEINRDQITGTRYDISPMDGDDRSITPRPYVIGTDYHRVKAIRNEVDRSLVRELYEDTLKREVEELKYANGKIVEELNLKLTNMTRERDGWKLQYDDIKTKHESHISGQKIDHQVILSENNLHATVAKSKADVEIQSRKLDTERELQPYKLEVARANGEVSTLKVVAAIIPLGLICWKAFGNSDSKIITALPGVRGISRHGAAIDALTIARKSLSKALYKSGKKLLKQAYCMVNRVSSGIIGGIKRVCSTIASWFQ